jgi:hypothetical protein
MRDVIADVLGDDTREAAAAGDAGEDSGTCGCTVTVSGPAQNTPASENPAQLKTGSVTGVTSGGSIVVSGPFVLTDASTDPYNATNNNNGASLVLQAAAPSCLPLPPSLDSMPGLIMTVQPGSGGNWAAHGARYLVPAGQMLCAYLPPTEFAVTGGVQWAGFVPYMFSRLLRDQHAPDGAQIDLLLSDAQVMRLLEVEPELWRCVQGPAETERRVRRDLALAGNDCADAVMRHANGVGQLAGAHLERPEKLLAQNLPRVNGAHPVLGLHWV